MKTRTIKKVGTLVLTIAMFAFVAVPQTAFAVIYTEGIDGVNFDVEVLYDSDAHSLIAVVESHSMKAIHDATAINGSTFHGYASLWCASVECEGAVPGGVENGHVADFAVETIGTQNLDAIIAHGSSTNPNLILRLTPEIEELVTNNPGVYSIYATVAGEFHNPNIQDSAVKRFVAHAYKWFRIPARTSQLAITDGIANISANVASTQTAVTSGTQAIEDHLEEQDLTLSSQTTKLNTISTNVNSIKSYVTSIYSKVQQIYCLLSGCSSGGGGSGGGTVPQV